MGGDHPCHELPDPCWSCNCHSLASLNLGTCCSWHQRHLDVRLSRREGDGQGSSGDNRDPLSNGNPHWHWTCLHPRLPHCCHLGGDRLEDAGRVLCHDGLRPALHQAHTACGGGDEGWPWYARGWVGCSERDRCHRDSCPNWEDGGWSRDQGTRSTWLGGGRLHPLH